MATVSRYCPRSELVSTGTVALGCVFCRCGRTTAAVANSRPMTLRRRQQGTVALTEIVDLSIDEAPHVIGDREDSARRHDMLMRQLVDDTGHEERVAAVGGRPLSTRPNLTPNA